MGLDFTVPSEFSTRLISPCAEPLDLPVTTAGGGTVIHLSPTDLGKGWWQVDLVSRHACSVAPVAGAILFVARPPYGG